jgi:hypothetical protein
LFLLEAEAPEAEALMVEAEALKILALLHHCSGHLVHFLWDTCYVQFFFVSGRVDFFFLNRTSGILWAPRSIKKSAICQKQLMSFIVASIV